MLNLTKYLKNSKNSAKTSKALTLIRKACFLRGKPSKMRKYLRKKRKGSKLKCSQLKD